MLCYLCVPDGFPVAASPLPSCFRYYVKLVIFIGLRKFSNHYFSTFLYLFMIRNSPKRYVSSGDKMRIFCP